MKKRLGQAYKETKMATIIYVHLFSFFCFLKLKLKISGGGVKFWINVKKIWDRKIVNLSDAHFFLHLSGGFIF